MGMGALAARRGAGEHARVASERRRGRYTRRRNDPRERLVVGP